MKYNEYTNITNLCWDDKDKTLLGVSVDENQNETYIDLTEVLDKKFLKILETHVNASNQHELVNEEDNGFISPELLNKINKAYDEVVASNILGLDRQLIENFLQLEDYTILDIIDYKIINNNICIQPFKYIYKNKICVSQIYMTTLNHGDVIHFNVNKIIKRNEVNYTNKIQDLFVVDLELDNMVKPIYKIYCNSQSRLLDIINYNINSYTNLNPLKSLSYGEIYDKDQYMNYICSIDFEKDDINKATGRSLSKNCTYTNSPIGQVHKSSSFEGDYVHISEPMKAMTLSFVIQKNEFNNYAEEKIMTFLDSSTKDILSIYTKNNGLYVSHLNKPILVYENIESKIFKCILKYQDNSLYIQADGDPVGRMVDINMRNIIYFLPCFTNNMISNVNLFDRIVDMPSYVSNLDNNRLDGYIENGLICRKNSIYVDKTVKDSDSLKIIRDIKGNIKNIRIIYNGDGSFLKCTTNINGSIICNKNDISIDITQNTDSVLINTVYVSPFINQINNDIHKIYMDNIECMKDNNILITSNILRNTIPNKKFSRECNFDISNKFTNKILNSKVIKNVTLNIEGQFNNAEVFMSINTKDKVKLTESHYIQTLDIKNLKDFNVQVTCKDSNNAKLFKMYVNVELYDESYICKNNDKVENILCLSNNYVNSLNDNCMNKIEMVYNYEPPFFIDTPKENSLLVAKTFRYSYYIEDGKIFKTDNEMSKCYKLFNKIVGGGY